MLLGRRLARAFRPVDLALRAEAADVLFHLYVLLAVAGVDVADVEAELASRQR